MGSHDGGKASQELTRLVKITDAVINRVSAEYKKCILSYGVHYNNGVCMCGNSLITIAIV